MSKPGKLRTLFRNSMTQSRNHHQDEMGKGEEGKKNQKAINNLRWDLSWERERESYLCAHTDAQCFPPRKKIFFSPVDCCNAGGCFHTTEKYCSCGFFFSSKRKKICGKSVLEGMVFALLPPPPSSEWQILAIRASSCQLVGGWAYLSDNLVTDWKRRRREHVSGEAKGLPNSNETKYNANWTNFAKKSPCNKVKTNLVFQSVKILRRATNGNPGLSDRYKTKRVGSVVLYFCMLEACVSHERNGKGRNTLSRRLLLSSLRSRGITLLPRKKMNSQIHF